MVMHLGRGECPECESETTARSGNGYIHPEADLEDLPPAYEESCTECDWRTTNPEKGSDVFAREDSQ